MDAYQELIRRLRMEGHRLTPQRQLILRALVEGEGHMTAAEILERVRQEEWVVTRPTIYRNLDLLCRAGVLSATDLGGGITRYELALDDSHHHLVCRSCGTVLELDDELLQPLQREIQARYRFQPDISHLALHGLCQACRG